MAMSQKDINRTTIGVILGWIASVGIAYYFSRIYPGS